ncbi:MAG: peptidylprolyl isomerase, partial [Ruminococcus sp.]|nr:peptidylprolyl isomerase [Ruminococcus sp.]
DFMIQGGDPNGDGTGGESTWGGEFDGGTDPHAIHAAGAIAYANSGSTATDGSQFYIVTGEKYTDAQFDDLEKYGYRLSDNAKEVYRTQGGTPFLDGSYTVFGQVFDGLDIVFRISEVETGDNDKPAEPVTIESVTIGEYDGRDVRWYMSDYGDTSSNAEESDAETETEAETEAAESETEAAETEAAEESAE